jgi:hypothetical protein
MEADDEAVILVLEVLVRDETSELEADTVDETEVDFVLDVDFVWREETVREDTLLAEREDVLEALYESSAEDETLSGTEKVALIAAVNVGVRVVVLEDKELAV